MPIGAASPRRAFSNPFPLLTLEGIYGAITFYLANQAAVDQTILEDETEFERMHRESQERNAEIYARIEKARS